MISHSVRRRIMLCCTAAALVMAGAGLASAADRATTTPADAAIDALITQLGDRAPDVREAAQEKLAKIGRPARGALVAAAATATPQRRSAARELLSRLPLFDSSDPKPLRDMLALYQGTPPEAKAQHALRLLSHGEATGLEAASRIVVETGDETVLWPFVAAITQADRDRLVASPAFAAAEPVGPARLYLAGASLFNQDRPRGVTLLERALSQLNIAPPPARPALLHIAEMLATDARERNDPKRELQVRRDAALLVPLMGEVIALETGVATHDFSDPYLAYLATRVRLHDSAGLTEDLASLGDTEAKSLSSLVLAILAEPRIDAPPPADNDDPAEVIRRVPGKIWEAFDELATEDQIVGLEMIYRGGDFAVADAISRRMLVSAPVRLTPDLVQRARVMAIRAALAVGPKARAAARDGLRAALFDQHGEIRIARLSAPRREEQTPGELSNWPADVYAWEKIGEVRLAMERHDAAGINAALDALTPVPIDNPTMAIDVVRVFEMNGRFEEADEVFDDYVDTANDRMDSGAGSLNSLAWFCARTGRDMKRAYALAVRATAMSPTAALKDTLAEAAFRLGKVDEAVRAEAEALQSMPEYDFMVRQLDRFQAGIRPGDAERALPSESWER